MKRKSYRVRPSKANGVISIVVGIVFVFVGITLAIPDTGFFGVVWTLIAVLITVVNVRAAFSENGHSFEITEETPANNEEKSAENRLRELESLRGAGLISDDEYRRKRRDIIDGI